MPIYFSIGNHERYEDLDAILQRLERLGVKVLRTGTPHGAVQLIGIDDSEHPGQVKRELAKVEIDNDRSSCCSTTGRTGWRPQRSRGRPDDLRPYPQRADRAV